MKNVTLGAINGLLVSVDPFSSYLNAEQYKRYQKTLADPKAGVGLLLSRKYGYEIGIVDAIPGSPADKAGLSTGDIIEAINGISTRDMPLAYADVLLHGDPGSTVELTILRLRKPEPAKVVLTRAVVTPPAVEFRMVDKETGLILVNDLSKGKSAKVRESIASLEKQGAKKLVLDLRHSALSDPEEGVALANLFIDKGTLSSLSGQKHARQVFEADAAKVAWKGPLVVLTNRGTAGAAEIAAAAILDNKRASVVGERTYGNAALRKAVSTEDGGAVLLAVAKYYSPSGKAIQDASVTPSVAVADTDVAEAPDEDQPAPAAPEQKPATKGEDAILKKGLEVLQSGVVAAQNQPGSNQTAAGDRMGPLGVPRRQ